MSLSGTAADSGGGAAGAVEGSLDGGKTWHPAVGRENWSYTTTIETASGWQQMNFSAPVVVKNEHQLRSLLSASSMDVVFTENMR